MFRLADFLSKSAKRPVNEQSDPPECVISRPFNHLNSLYTLEYLQSFEGKPWETGIGSRSVWHDISMKQWRLTVQLEEKGYWFLSVFIREDGTFSKFSLDEERADDSHYEFVNEEAIRRKIYQPGDEKLLLDDILIRYARENGAGSLLTLIGPYVTEEFHYYG